MEVDVVAPTPEVSVNEFAHLGLDATGNPLPEPESGAEEPESPTEGQPPVEDGATEEAEQAKQKSDRYRELILRRKEAEAEAAAQRAERERLQQELEALKKAPQRVEDSGLPPRPSLDQFQTVAEWQQADTEWIRQFTERQFQTREERRQQEEAQRKAESDFQTSIQTFEKAEADYKTKLGDKAADYDRATEQLKLFTRGNPAFVRALLNTSPEVVYAVGQDVELADRLSHADPLTIGLELGRLQSRVTDGGRQGRKFVSQAPPPERTIQGVRSAPTTNLDRFQQPGNGDEYARWRDAQEAEKRRLRAAR